MIAETSFIMPRPNRIKSEVIDRLEPVVADFPKYKSIFEELVINFIVDDMLYLMNVINRDSEFKASCYYTRYSEYFDEIEDIIHNGL